MDNEGTEFKDAKIQKPQTYCNVPVKWATWKNRFLGN